MNLPNKLTVMRILLIPVIVIIAILEVIVKIEFFTQTLGKTGMSVANLIILIIFCIASFTDFLDGNIARKRNLVTDFGKFLDPLADKLLVSSAMIYLIEVNRLWGFAVIIIIAREFAVTGLRLIASNKGKVIAASKWGKSKTVSQMIMVIFLLLNGLPFSLISDGAGKGFQDTLILIAVLLTVISGIDYFAKNKEMLNDR